MNDWSKRKRLEATIAGDETDRTPVALWRHWPGDDQDAEALAAAHLKWQRDYDWDFVKVSPASSFCLVDWGVEDVWQGEAEGTRAYTRRAVHQAQDWAALPRLDPGKGMLATQIEALKLVGRGLGEETPFLATIFSPLAQAKNLAGEEVMLSHMRRRPELFQQGLKTITAATLAYLEAAKATGISGIFYALQHCRYALMSPAEYQLFGRPYDEEILAAATDLWLTMVHVHGEDIFFDLAADYPVPLINWHDRESGISLAQGLQQVSGAVSGGVSRQSMFQDGPAAAVAEARDALEQTNGRRFVLGTGCVIMTNTPLRNVRALRELVDGNQ
jgi:uroporphyrinogen decarboxylase